MKRNWILTGLLFVALGAGAQTFRADRVVNSLAGWSPMGQADWTVDGKALVGTPRQPGGGWLVLDQGFQNVAVFTELTCSGGCKAGILMRAEKTAEGMKGIFYSLTEGDLNAYSIRLDAQGRELSREKLAPGVAEGGLSSSSGLPGAISGAALPGGSAAPRIPPPAPPVGVALPELTKAQPVYKPGVANQFDLFLFADLLKVTINGGASGGLTRAKAESTFGPIALYVGGTGTAKFDRVGYRDLSTWHFPTEKTSLNYRKQHLDSMYTGWSAAVADFNKDGIPDIAAGPYVYLGPSYTEAKLVYTPFVYNPAYEYPQLSMVNLAYDFTGDGWPDLLVMSGSAGVGAGNLYVNPGRESRMWAKYVVIKPVGNEETLLMDLDGDGKPEVIHAGDNTLRYSKPDPANPTGTWITTNVSEPGLWGVAIGHGLGVGDINGDGRKDFINSFGWWEQPAKGSAPKTWAWHPEEFGRRGMTQGGAGGAEIGVYDVNGDGLNDVVGALEGHGWGLAWFEQKRDAAGRISFVRHMIMDNFATKNAGGVTFTEPHATGFADMDGDGLPDLITGKRAMSHLFGFNDPDPLGEPVVYVYRTVRNPKAPGGAEFVPELVNNRSGVGSHLAVVDLNKDGRPDIVTSTVTGTYVFYNNMKRAVRVVK